MISILIATLISFGLAAAPHSEPAAASTSGCPAGTSPFEDVAPTSLAFDDVACIYRLGITKGTSRSAYSPAATVTRGQMASFLARFWRATGLKPGPGVVPVRPHLKPPQPLPTTPGSTFVFEGTWTPRGPLIDGYRGVYTTVVSPSALEPSIIALEAWIDPMLTNLELLPGSQRAGGSWAQPNYVPADKCQSLIFAGNGGFKFEREQSRGGYYSEGRVAYPLRDGAASFVFFKHHTVDIVQWGREVGTPELSTISSVRQNLELIVDEGSVVPHLDYHYQGWWGWLVDNSVWVGRSGWGITESGAILYVGGPGLGVRDLAERLIDVGGFRRPGDRYLSPDSTDFVGVFADHSRWSS